MAKDMTINELATVVSQSFTAQQKFLDKKFAEIDARFSQIDDRFDQIDGRFAQNENRFDAIEKKLEEHDEKFDQIITILDNHTHTLDRLDQERLFTYERIKRIEADVERLKTRLKIS